MADQRPDRVRGPLHDDFWAWCDRGELRLQRCSACNRVSWPVAPACEYCASPLLAFQPMSGRATLVSWCVFERDYYGGKLPAPWETILVELEEDEVLLVRLDRPARGPLLEAEEDRVRVPLGPDLFRRDRRFCLEVAHGVHPGAVTLSASHAAFQRARRAQRS